MKRKQNTPDYSRWNVADFWTLAPKQRKAVLRNSSPDTPTGLSHLWFATLVDKLSPDKVREIHADTWQVDDWASELLASALIITPNDELDASIYSQRRDGLYLERVAKRMGEYVRAGIDQGTPCNQLVVEVRNILVGWLNAFRRSGKAAA